MISATFSGSSIFFQTFDSLFSSSAKNASRTFRISFSSSVSSGSFGTDSSGIMMSASTSSPRSSRFSSRISATVVPAFTSPLSSSVSWSISANLLTPYPANSGTSSWLNPFMENILLMSMNLEVADGLNPYSCFANSARVL